MKIWVYKKILLVFCFIGWVSLGATVSASNSTLESLWKNYDSFIQKLELKYNDAKIVWLLEQLSISLDSMMLKKGISQSKKDYIRFLYDLNRQKITSLQASLTKNGDALQKSKEFKYIIILKSQNAIKTIPNYIQTLIQKGKSLYNTNSTYEYFDETEKAVKRINFEKFYKVDPQSVELLKDRDGIVVSSKEGDYIFIETYTIENKYPFSSFYSDNSLKSKFIDLDKKYLQEGDTYYTYIFNQYKVFADEYGFYDSTFTRNNINKSDVWFVRDSDGRFGYVDDYKKVKLISDSLLSKVSNKDKFLAIIADDKKYLSWDTDADFRNLERTVWEVVWTNDTKEEKIKKIYGWILDNISYSKEFNIEDKQIFSGIDTFWDHEGVCDGYVKLMSYMLLYAWVTDSEILRWDVIDAQDFPYIWHAWLKIGNDYYDPTFDDPVGLTETLTFNQYRFFKLPRDLLYANRFDFSDTPESIKKASLQEREDLIKRNLSNLVSKYKSDNYLILKPFIFRKKYWFEYNQDIWVEDLKNIITYIQQISNTEIIKDGVKQKIRRFAYSYYTVDDSKNIDTILQTVNYKIENLFLLQMPWGEYRIGYNLIIE